MYINERQLVFACQKLIASAQKEVYMKYSRYFRGICYRYAIDEDEAEDILQEGFIRIFSNIKSFHWKGEGTFFSWMKTIIINTSITWYNKHSKLRNHISLPEVIDEEADIEQTDMLIHTETFEYADITENKIMEILKSVPQEFRIVFNMYVIEGFKHKDIAQVLNIKEKTSRTRLLRARNILKQRLEDLGITLKN